MGSARSQARLLTLHYSHGLILGLAQGHTVPYILKSLTSEPKHNSLLEYKEVMGIQSRI